MRVLNLRQLAPLDLMTGSSPMPCQTNLAAAAPELCRPAPPTPPCAPHQGCWSHSGLSPGSGNSCSGWPALHGHSRSIVFDMDNWQSINTHLSAGWLGSAAQQPEMPATAPLFRTSKHSATMQAGSTPPSGQVNALATYREAVQRGQGHLLMCVPLQFSGLTPTGPSTAQATMSGACVQTAQGGPRS